MNDFLISLLLLDEGALIATNLLAIVVGGVIAAYTIRVNGHLRRVSYLWAVAAIGLVLSLSQLAWIFTPQAAEAGLFALVPLFSLAAFLLFGVFLYIASAARARDIDGTTSGAWLGFVPLANLWLMFKKGEPHPDAPPKGWVRRFVLDPVLVVAALLLLSVTQVLDKQMQKMPLYDVTESPALASMVANAQTLEQSFATEARLSGAELPIRIDGITVLREIAADGATLRLTYDIEREIPGFRPDFKQTLADAQCAPEMFGTDIRRGGTVELVYRGPDGRLIETFRITRADCRT